ncbi:MAG TPA: hypothetical protein VLI04_11295 [Nocardioidaceae bacterium]|nr:hypothetical protein [Nocardioidaceae bacterium]
MRRPIAVFLLVMALCAPFPASAGGPIATTISLLAVDPSLKRAGESFPLHAGLHTGKLPVVGKLLTLQIKRYGADTFQHAGSATTDVNGTATVQVPGRERTFRFRWVFAGSDPYTPSVSGVGVQTIGSLATIRVSDRTPAAGQAIVIKGRTRPAKPGHKVWLYRGFSAHGGMPIPGQPDPVLLATRKVRADGTYRFRFTFPNPGARRLFVDVQRGDGNGLGFSDPRYINVG